MRKVLLVLGAPVVTLSVALVGISTGAFSATAPVRSRHVDTSLRAGTAALATSSVSPAYLPNGATLVDQVDDARFPDVRENQYQLAGAANADTLGSAGGDAAASHSATVLTVTFVPGISSVPDLPADPTFYDIGPARIADLPGLLTQPKSGVGVYRVDWIDAEGYHVVLCERRQTPEGTSGLPADELIKIAASLYE